jgi:MFS family permease
MTPMFVSWAVSVFVSAWIALALGFRATALGGGALITAGMSLLTLGAARPDWSGVVFPIGLVVIGVGMGPTSLSFILNTQNAVPWNRRGVATGTVTFIRTMGGALGVGFLGARLTHSFVGRLADAGAAGIDVNYALRPDNHSLISPDQLATVQHALGASLVQVFGLMTVAALVTVAAASKLSAGPGKRPAPPTTANGEGSDADLAAAEAGEADADLSLAALPD